MIPARYLCFSGRASSVWPRLTLVQWHGTLVLVFFRGVPPAFRAPCRALPSQDADGPGFARVFLSTAGSRLERSCGQTGAAASERRSVASRDGCLPSKELGWLPGRSVFVLARRRPKRSERGRDR